MTADIPPIQPSPEAQSPHQSALADTPSNTAAMSSRTTTASKGGSPFVLLPSEILYMVLSMLSAPDLAAMSCTCRHILKHTLNDIIWMDLVNSNLPNPLSDPAPFDSWRELYISQYPMWFVARNKIWFSDVRDTGKLIVTRYNPRKCAIEGYRVVAKHTFHQFETWPYDTEVLVHSFKPDVTLWMDDPVIYLDKFIPSPSKRAMNWRFGEIRMPMPLEAQRVFSNFILCGKMKQEDMENPEKDVWPPRLIPSNDRADVSSCNPKESGLEGYEDICESAFHTRRWAQLGNFGAVFDGNNSRHGIATFASLQPELYTPTSEKPYQGIWVGDYSGHGSEYLLVLQRGDTFSMDDEHQGTDDGSSSSMHSSSDSSSSFAPQGRLEAIKLTGDPNVPRGEISFFAEDIGPKGLIRIADEDLFSGARVIRGQGHIASTNFRDDKFIPAQLFLITHDCMALFWEELKHISYYRRVDVDSLLSQELD
ncbi:hypothetical protein AJ79_08021 [Helicocarpus griseus UAMH5409]|uniref:F-box domain-containing protein n=1 Tax=Helicocarpus griseus UAMH5409 TaxID=1447875 RepID=A0A2B7WX19_9EURO|nr:hypothetical protein AJ79_08021 [Helicocarpus griseus UAMH5409]